MGAIMAEWAFEKHPDWRKAYVLEDPTIDYSKQHCEGFRQRWTELAGDGAIIGQDTIKQGDTSIAPQITQIKAGEEPSFIMLCSYLPGLARVAKQIRGAGIQTPLIAEASFDGEDWKSAVPNLSDTYFVTYASIYGDDPEPKVNEFYDKYREETGAEPATSYPLLGYSVVEAFARSMDRAGSTDGEKMADELEKFKDEPLLIGPTTFDSQLHISLKRPMRVMSITDGKTKYEETWTPESVPLPKT
jgi:branched-chain amino acid transport system substrate-binding protein